MPVSKVDSLNTPETACQADERSRAFGVADISNQYRLIEPYGLDENVPEVIITQYEVARNLYLYAYYVYRFYMTAQHQVLITLEFAIKERFGADIIAKYGRDIGMRRGLALCLRYVFDHDYLVDRDFPTWHQRNLRAAEKDYQIRKIEEMEARGLDSIELDYSEINPD